MKVKQSLTPREYREYMAQLDTVLDQAAHAVAGGGAIASAMEIRYSGLRFPTQRIIENAAAVRTRLERRLRVSPSGCWEFQKALSPKGYGDFSVRGFGHRAHRIAYQIYIGRIPPGMWVLHSCDNPRCCNPAHLRIGDHATNVRDKVTRGRAFHPRGELHPMHKLSARQVRFIRDHGGASHTALAARFGVTCSTIGDVLRRRSWKALP